LYLAFRVYVKDLGSSFIVYESSFVVYELESRSRVLGYRFGGFEGDTTLKMCLAFRVYVHDLRFMV
jgi:hypothetical protein